MDTTKNRKQIMDFFRDHWFQIILLAIGVFVAWIVYSALVIQPEKARQAESARQEAMQMALQEQEEERLSNLEQCLEESEYQRQSSHLALCGDPNVGRSPTSCSKVYGGATSVWSVMSNYMDVFPDWDKDLEDDSDRLTYVAGLIDAYTEECNCGLEKYRRDELDEVKSSSDNLCIAKYGKQ